MNDIYNVNAEYERIFGIRHKYTLFAPDDEDYLSLRREIINTRCMWTIKDKLPFEEVIDVMEVNEPLVFANNLFSPIIIDDWKEKSQKIAVIMESLLQSCGLFPNFGTELTDGS